jgi:hypothetical protein
MQQPADRARVPIRLSFDSSNSNRHRRPLQREKPLCILVGCGLILFAALAAAALAASPGRKDTPLASTLGVTSLSTAPIFAGPPLVYRERSTASLLVHLLVSLVN